MESLYVCHFSNGHIKVGRSIDAAARVAQHADRVACMGVELVEYAAFECVGPAAPREAMLISRCVDAADARFQNEWFEGLDYLDVHDWARQCAQEIIPDPTFGKPEQFGDRLKIARKAKGLTQAELAKGLRPDGGDLGKAAISHWEINRGSPNVKQIKAVCERLNVSADYLLGILHSDAANDSEHKTTARG
jgi:DNA-binding XRE family transcriptional regulator